MFVQTEGSHLVAHGLQESLDKNRIVSVIEIRQHWLWRKMAVVNFSTRVTQDKYFQNTSTIVLLCTIIGGRKRIRPGAWESSILGSEVLDYVSFHYRQCHSTMEDHYTRSPRRESPALLFTSWCPQITLLI